MQSISGRVSNPMKRHYDHSNSYKGLTEGVAYRFKDLIYYHHHRDNGSIGEDVVLATP